MDQIVRAIDVGYGQTKFVSGWDGTDVSVSCFPSLAYPHLTDPLESLGADTRKTVLVPLQDRFYEVGPDVHLVSDGFRPSQIHDNYIFTPEYLALTRGALSLMNVETVDLLVVGLPVSHLASSRTALAKCMTGRHELHGGRSVSVRRAIVVAQPQGALFEYAATTGDEDFVADDKWTLVIDPGSRTFDWLVTQGRRIAAKRSYSVNRGVIDVLQLISEDIGKEIGRPYRHLEAIDQALRHGTNLSPGKKQYSGTRMRKIADNIAEQAVGAMRQRLDGVEEIHNIVLTGGGAHLFAKAIKDAFPGKKVATLFEPLFANVRGYQRFGVAYARANLKPHAKDE